MNNELHKMKNLGKTSVLLLGAVGIRSAEQLRQHGPVGAYRKIKEKGLRTSKTLLYSIEGALLDLHWCDIPPDRKSRLDEELEQSQSAALAARRR